MDAISCMLHIFKRALDFTCLILQDEGGDNYEYLKVAKHSLISDIISYRKTINLIEGANFMVTWVLSKLP